MAEEMDQAGNEINRTSPPAPQTNTQPPRVMGFADLVMFYVVTGISLRWIATAAAAGPSSIVIWIGVWLCFYCRLLFPCSNSSRYPKSGLYVWSKRIGDFSTSVRLDLTDEHLLFPRSSSAAATCRCLFPAVIDPSFRSKSYQKGFRFSLWWPLP
jgi:hypothetical protein